MELDKSRLNEGYPLARDTGSGQDMLAKRGLIKQAGLALLVALPMCMAALATPVFSNAWMLLVDRQNFIPAPSSIWTFEPYEINQGSSNYWIYGEDRINYYYFAYTPEAPFQLISKHNQCVSFDKRDVRTWCMP